jgi:dTDP-4-dehydrorhamnose 3,5-epimerase
LKLTKTKIEGLLIIEPDIYGDERGFFLESFNIQRYKKHGLNFDFVQDNISKSVKNTIRGLHYQVGDMAQGKLCQVLYGKVLDVAVDIRFGSPTFGKHFTHVLNSNRHSQIWIPPGLAHGFAVLSEEALFVYKCTNYYSKEHERTILYSDDELKIDWEVKNPIVSEKDFNGIKFKDIEKDFIYAKV